MAHQELDVDDFPGLYLVSAFLAMEPVDHLLSLARNRGGGSISVGVQRFIWDHCISNAWEFVLKSTGDDTGSGKSHAPYLRTFLKRVITEVESSGDEVLEEIYEQFAYYMSSIKDVTPGEGNSWILKCISFLFHDGASRLVFPLQCSLNMLDGDTGCSLWPSSLFLSEFILCYPEFFTNKSCFEVGSGVGLVGICLEHVKASKVIMSDGDLSSLTNLKVNLKMNQILDTDVVKCIHLSWESAKQSVLREFMPDIVLGADVIYDPSCLPHLVRVLYSLLQLRKTRVDQYKSSITECNVPLRYIDGDSNDVENQVYGYNPKLGEGNSVVGDKSHYNCGDADKPEMEIADAESLACEMESGPVALIACVVRNISTFKHFIALAKEASLSARDLSETMRPARLLPYSQSYSQSDVKLLLISLQQ